MLAAILLQASDSSLDLGPLIDDLQGKAWVAAAVVGVGLVVAVLKKLGVLDKLTGKAPAAPAPVPVPVDPKPAAEAQKAQDLLDGKK